MITLGWVYWVVWQLVSLVVTVVGWFLLLPFALLHAWVERPGRSWMFPNPKITAWRGGVLMSLWDNEEDGVDGAEWYRVKYKDRSVWYNAYAWSAWRNSANGMRWLPGAAFLITKRDLVIKKTTFGYVARCGWRPCWQYKRIRVGWLINLDADDGWRSWPIAELI